MILNQKKIEDKSFIKEYRIAKYISIYTKYSRREAESLIKEGRIKVNGKLTEELSLKITDQSIKLDNKLINNNASQSINTRLWLFYKERFVIVSKKDEKNRTNIYNIINNKYKISGNFIVIGRLDFLSEGLILVTNNGNLSHYIMSPSNNWIRKYKVRVYGKVNVKKLQQLEKKPFKIDGVTYKKIKIDFSDYFNKVDNKIDSKNSWLTISLTEGKNREIRKILSHFDLSVNRLIRISFGPFDLGSLKKSELKEVPQKQIKSFFSQNLLHI